MLRTFRLGKLVGFPIEVNLTFLLMLGAVLLWMGGLPGVFVVLLAFGSVLLHELGHAVVARRLGVHVAGIELHFFGGAAKLAQQPRNARDEILIALAGPAVSIALAATGWLAFALTGATLFYLIAWINSIIGVFNLIPAMPMDGGRVFRALLTRKLSFARATEIAVNVARVFAIALGVYALATAQIYLVLLAVVLWFMGTAELRAARHFGYRDRPEVEVLDPRPGAVSPGLWPFGPAPRTPRRPRQVVVRRVGGRTVVEIFE